MTQPDTIDLDDEFVVPWVALREWLRTHDPLTGTRKTGYRPHRELVRLMDEAMGDTLLIEKGSREYGDKTQYGWYWRIGAWNKNRSRFYNDMVMDAHGQIRHRIGFGATKGELMQSVRVGLDEWLRYVEGVMNRPIKED